MSCKRYRQMIALEAGGDLPDARHRRLERHLLDCAGCRSLLEELKESRQATISLVDQGIAAKTLERVRARVLQQIDSEPHPLGQPTWLRSLTTPQARWAAVTAVLVLVVAIWIWPGLPGFRGERERPTVETQVAPTVPEAQPSPLRIGDEMTGQGVPVVAASQDPDVERAASDRLVSTKPDLPTLAEETRVAERSPSDSGEARPLQPIAPMIIKLVSDQEDVVIYWLVGEESQDKESKNAV